MAEVGRPEGWGPWQQAGRGDRRGGGRGHRWFGRVLRGLTLLVLAVLVVLFGRSYLVVRAFEVDREMEAATILSRDGEVIATVGQRIVYVPLSRIAPSMTQAVVAAEDRRFYRHPGIDPIGIARALVTNLRAGGTVEGASTITQQLARTLFLTRERTVARKLEEAALALMLESRFTKDRILELYLNHVFFGEGATGVEAAAKTYFGRSASELTLAQSALLTGLLPAPALFSPYQNPDRALERREHVLRAMVEEGFITPAQAAEAAGEPLQLARRSPQRAPYFVDYVTGLLVDRFGANLVHRGGLRVHTGLDLQVQRAAEEALGNHQGAIVALDPRTGEIRAMVGGRDYAESQFNRAVSAFRQPGSAFKPIVYAAALEAGFAPNTIVQDVPQRFGDYAPKNFDNEYWGPVTLRHALTFSLNNASVWILNQIGIDRAMEMAARLGIDTLDSRDRHLALALGGLTRGVTPVAMAAAFVPFANGGLRVPVQPFTQVTDREGRVWFEAPSRPASERVLEPAIAYLMTDMMRGVLEERGATASLSGIGRPAAGKTGTSDDRINAWFIGYTPDLLAAVYIGNDNRSPVPGGGGTLAAPVWSRFMRAALAGTPPSEFAVPRGVVTGVLVDVFTGLLATEACPWTERSAFLQGTEPLSYAPCAFGFGFTGTGSGPGLGSGTGPFTSEPGQVPALPPSGLGGAPGLRAGQGFPPGQAGQGQPFGFDQPMPPSGGLSGEELRERWMRRPLRILFRWRWPSVQPD